MVERTERDEKYIAVGLMTEASKGLAFLSYIVQDTDLLEGNPLTSVVIERMDIISSDFKKYREEGISFPENSVAILREMYDVKKRLSSSLSKNLEGKTNE